MILAGGLGTRLRPLTETMPKAMTPVRGRPFLEYEIALLSAAGVTDLVLCVGYMGDAIERHFGGGSEHGVSIRYSRDGPGLIGPAGALKRAEPLLEEAFFVTYGDAYLRAPYREIMQALVSSKALGMMAVYENDNRLGRSDLVVEGGRVVRYDKKGAAEGMHWINFGVSALRRAALDLIPPDRACDEEEFYGRLIGRGELLAFEVKERFYEIGTPGSLKEFEAFVSGDAGGAP